MRETINDRDGNSIEESLELFGSLYTYTYSNQHVYELR